MIVGFDGALDVGQFALASELAAGRAGEVGDVGVSEKLVPHSFKYFQESPLSVGLSSVYTTRQDLVLTGFGGVASTLWPTTVRIQR